MDKDDNSVVRIAYAREEIISLAHEWMVEMYGKPEGTADDWMAKFGLLCSFLHDNFPGR